VNLAFLAHAVAIGREATRRVVHDIAKDVAMAPPESAIAPQ
jgi:hypothetical protein